MFYICTINFNFILMEEDFNFEDFSVDVDSDCVTNDFDDYDLYGEIMEDDNASYVVYYDNMCLCTRIYCACT